jgi:glycosyltransferase involved in cell wall biosynthesis
MSERTAVLELRSVRGTGGGPEKTILMGAERRNRDRFDVTVCYIRDARDRVFGIDERAKHLDVDYLEAREQHSLDLRLWRALKAIVGERAIDIVHAHDYKTDVLAWLLGRRTGVTPLATAHGWTGHSPRERRVYYPLDKRVLARFPRVIAVSSEIARELVRTGSRPDRVTVILNGIDPAAFQPDASRRARTRQRFGFDDDAIVVGSVGRLETQKRFDLLIDAFAMIARDRPRLRLVIAGDGSLRGALEAQIGQRGLEAVCRLIGHQADVPAVYDAIDLFVQSSEYEGTPNVILEAMAMETPIVATDVGGTRELAADGEHAAIVPPHDTAALARAMAGVLDAPAAAEARVAAARRRVETDLSFDARTRRLEAIYDELAGARGAARDRRGGAPGRGPHA